ncbi:MAG: twitching motility protein PilT [Rhodospirillales bacterium RIFCSPLOWO2_12_FULL_58_28]|nr:MAG: twitching motility protein PilT [Rhodospirillales bacterium RIFCSPLOWO2_02_FULL_58_16]OHC77741.1 MAG: twitching motility protein PilT [Rhodospirillales bacterium RIFCSPLOWO2_12_FULL_58_28]
MSAHVYLLDTNVLLAALLAPERLPPEVAAGLTDASNTVYFSAASIWEIAIKRSLNRANFDFSPEDIHRLARDTGFAELRVNGEDCYPLVNLPWRHRDPFDRLLVVQAQSLPAYLLTTDGVLRQYSELVVHLTLKP